MALLKIAGWKASLQHYSGTITHFHHRVSVGANDELCVVCELNFLKSPS